MKDYSKIKTYFLDHKLLILGVTISGIFYNGTMWMIAFMQGNLVNKVIDGESSKSIILYGILVVGLILFIQINRFLKRLFVRMFNNKMVLKMREVSMENIIKKPLSFYEFESKEDIANKSISDIRDTAEGVRKILTEVFDTGVALLGYFIFLFVLDWKISIFVLIFAIGSFFTAEAFREKIIKTNLQYKKDLSEYKSRILSGISNENNYRALSVKKHYDSLAYDTSKKLEKSSIKVNIYNTIGRPVYTVVAMASVIFVIYFGGLNIQNGSWNIGIFLMYFSSFGLISKKLSKLGKTVNNYHKALVSYKRCVPFLKPIKDDDMYLISEKTYLSINKASIKKDKFKLNDVNLNLENGDLLAVSGMVKTGKSTFMEMLTNLYEYEGSIKVNDDELRDLKNLNTEKLLSYKSSVTDIFDDTIENNILFSNPGDIKHLLKILNLDKIDLNKKKLSGGERDRVGIARAFASDSKIIILDDPFNGLDVDLSKKIVSELKKISKDKIVIITTNNIEIVKYATKVLYLSEDESIFGTTDYLLKNKDYNRLIGGKTNG